MRLKRFISAPVAILIVIMSTVNAYALTSKEPYDIGIGIGDYIQFGKYYDDPILWRYVADDENGKLILSDKIICKKPYDVYNSRVSGSHTRRYAISNYWGDSTTRSWLNSKAPAGKVNWLCGNPPDRLQYFEGSYHEYCNEAGFLSDGNFTQSERMVIKKVKQKSLLDKVDADCAVGGDPIYWGKSLDSISDFVINRYDKISYEYTEDMMFILDIKQLYSIMQNSAILGDTYHISAITQKAKENSKYMYEMLEKNKGTDFGDSFIDSFLKRTTDSYYLRTPYGYDLLHYDSPFSEHIEKSGNMVIEVCDEPTIYDIGGVYIFVTNSYYNDSGIRPAFYLNERNADIVSGSGTEDDPYVLTGKAGTENMEDDAYGAAEEYNPIGIDVYVNGVKTWFPHDPFIENDRIFVSVLWINKILGNNILYHSNDDSIEFLMQTLYTTFKYGSNIGTTQNGEQVTWRAAPQRIDGVPYIPLRDYCESINIAIDWDETKRCVYITKR